MNELAKINKSIEVFKNVTSMEMVIADKSISLARMKKGECEKETIKFISKFIIKLNNSLNIQRKMNFEQITNTAEFILKYFYYLKQSDLYFVFTEAQIGRYGEFYESIDCAKIISWFDKYVEQRAEFCYEKGMKRHEQTKDSKIF